MKKQIIIHFINPPLSSPAQGRQGLPDQRAAFGFRLLRAEGPQTRVLIGKYREVGDFTFTDEQSRPLQQSDLKVPEMKCNGCARSITQELKKPDHVSDVYVDVKTKTAIVAVDPDEAPGEKAILAAVKTAGYDASGYAKLRVKFAEATAALAPEKGLCVFRVCASRDLVRVIWPISGTVTLR